MNRLVRIALTLFASATLMVFLSQRRLALVENIYSSGGKSGDLENEIKMAYMGLGLAGFMLAAGLALVITAVIRSRKKSAGHG